MITPANLRNILEGKQPSIFFDQDIRILPDKIIIRRFIDVSELDYKSLERLHTEGVELEVKKGKVIIPICEIVREN